MQKLCDEIAQDNFLVLDMVRMAYDCDIMLHVTLLEESTTTLRDLYIHLMIKVNRVKTTSLTNIDKIAVNGKLHNLMTEVLGWSQLMDSETFESLVLWSITGKRIIENQVSQIVEDYLHFTQTPKYYKLLFSFYKENKITMVTFINTFAKAANVDVITAISEFLNPNGTNIPSWEELHQITKKIANTSINTNADCLKQIESYLPAIQNSLLMVLTKCTDNKLLTADAFNKVIKSKAA